MTPDLLTRVRAALEFDRDYFVELFGDDPMALAGAVSAEARTEKIVAALLECAEACDTIDRLFWDPHAIKDLAREASRKLARAVGDE